MPPTTVPLAGLIASRLALGNRFSCARLIDASVMCWGSGEGGVLGNGNDTNIGDEPGEMPPPPVST